MKNFLIVAFLFLSPVLIFAQTAECDTSLLKYVHEPERFEVKSICTCVTGRVTHKNRERDGDLFIRIKLDEQYKEFLNEGNYKHQHGKMIAEFICTCKVKRDEAKNGCEHYSNKFKVPGLFQKVRVCGSYVLDKNHGWMEIHPVMKIELKN